MTTPYYSDDLVTLFLGDCREVTEWLEADVLVTDPPYGMGYRDRQGVDIMNDATTAIRDMALAKWGSFAHWNDSKPALIFGTWKVDRPKSARQVLIWDKSGGGGFSGAALPWGNTHEEVYVMGRWPKPVSGGRAREGGIPSIGHSVLRVAVANPASADRPGHPTPKPVGLMERLIIKCPPGTIADPFAGSGSTLIAAKQLGRTSIGVEIDERYCEIAARRLAQDTLFGGVA